MNKVIGFWHICMINHYYDIITEQLKLLIDSGLYEQAENIFVGCVGKDLNKLQELFKPHRKIKILSHSDELTQYEFLTLRILRDKSRSEKPFYGFYLHTKGVSYPGNEGGDHWRDYMNYYLLTKWQDNVNKLDEGFETSGVKFIDKGFPPHYSGNFFWFKSAYAKTLAPIDKLNKNDRFSAEMWLCSNNPKVACLCDNFVDYHSKGKFIPGEVITIEKPVVQPPIVQPQVVVEVVKDNRPRWSDVVKGDTVQANDIRTRLNRFEDIATEVIGEFLESKSTNVEQLIGNLSFLMKTNWGYNFKKKA